MPSNAEVKAQTQARFGQFAQGYVESKGHASGDDLEKLVEMAQPQTGWLTLDVATGGGHTALKFAPLVGRVISSDLTPPMLNAARSFIRQQGQSNVEFSAADAENLPFATGTFDLVTSRIAPHHFPDCFRFVQESARVLKPGGLLLIEDNSVPEDDRAARYVDAFERLRDPSHYRMYAEYEWRGMYLDAGLTVERVELIEKKGNDLVNWAERQGCTPDVIERLQILLQQAPQAAAEWMRPQAAGTTSARFDHHYILIMGRKPAAA